MKSFSYRLIIYCSAHYWKLLGISVLLFFAVCFYKVFLLFPHPVITKGMVIDDKVVSRSRSRGFVNLDIVPIIEFIHGAQKYRAVGGSSQQFRTGQQAIVIFNEAAPQKASELSFMGLIDFPVTYYAFFIWFFLSTLLYGSTAFNKHFAGLNLDFNGLTLSKVILISLLLLAIPLLKNYNLLLYGKTAQGMVIIDNVTGSDFRHHNSIVYNVSDKQYKLKGEGEFDDKLGANVSVIYDVSDPDNVLLYSFTGLYLNEWCIFPGVGLIFLIAVYRGSKVKNDEDED